MMGWREMRWRKTGNFAPAWLTHLLGTDLLSDKWLSTYYAQGLHFDHLFLSTVEAEEGVAIFVLLMKCLRTQEG